MTNQEPNESIIQLIQKCLNLSKSPNKHEAARAMEKVQELLEKYNLSMRDVEVEEQSKASNMVEIEVPVGSSDWKRYLIHYVARANFCEILISGKNVLILGRDANVLSVGLMSAWIVDQLENMAYFETHTYDGPTPKLKFRNSFLWGAVNTINERLQEGRKEREKVSPDLKALVLDLNAETNLFYKERHPRVSTHQGSGTTTDYDAYNRGKEAGNKVSLYGSNKQASNNQLLLQ